MSKPLRFGVIGTGWAQMVHLPGLKNCPDAEIAAICARNQEKASEVAAHFNIPSVWADYREMLNKADLDAVVVCAPDDLHFEMSMAAIARGLHVVCEKPLTLDAHEARQMLEAAERAGIRHMTCYNWRLVPAFNYLRALVAQGYVGAIRDVELRWPFPTDTDEYNWHYDSRRAKGILSNLGSHLIDLACWIAGPVARVGALLAVFTTMRGPEGQEVPRSNDAASLLLEFRNGAHGMIWTRLGSCETLASTITVDGSAGCLRATISLAGMSLSGRKAGEEAEHEIEIPSVFLEGFPPNVPILDAWFALVTDGRHFTGEFVRAIREQRPYSPSFVEGLEAMKVIDAALESSRTGRIITVE